jgi:hypothetical protein
LAKGKFLDCHLYFIDGETKEVMGFAQDKWAILGCIALYFCLCLSHWLFHHTMWTLHVGVIFYSTNLAVCHVLYLKFPLHYFKDLPSNLNVWCCAMVTAAEHWNIFLKPWLKCCCEVQAAHLTHGVYIFWAKWPWMKHVAMWDVYRRLSFQICEGKKLEKIKEKETIIFGEFTHYFQYW